MSGATAVEPGRLLGCESCGLVSAAPPADDPTVNAECPRCGHTLRAAKPYALQRTWALVVGAAILYVPANALPVMMTTSALQHDQHTLLGGIHELWLDGSWGLAMIVFIASIAVPVLKIAALGLLAWTVRHRPHWRRLERARLYRLVETVGHWSMLDVYVVVLLAATVRFGPLASVDVGLGLLSFAAVVVLTMFATWSFDPRLIWRDAAADGRDA
ncbi:MAG TPA: paraquat-inducible protein A [Caldimonas sp.]|jgi:paraquat-inducible protein A|nr:paraquat-inducible protein A [Caldimonas sp.]HEX4236296.1 paraquat-inducible protein A [Caldimonas sp.]